MSEDQLRDYVNRRLTGAPDPEGSADPGDYGPGGVHYVAPDPIHAELYRRALADELEAEIGDSEAEEQERASYDPDALATFAGAAAAAMGFEPRSEEPMTPTDRWFEGADEGARDAAWTAWFAGLSAEDQAGVMAADPAAVESFQAFVELGPLTSVAAIAAQVPGARLVEDRLHRPLNRFRG